MPTSSAARSPPASPRSRGRSSASGRRTERSSRATRSSCARSQARGRRAAPARSAGVRAPRRKFAGSLNFDQGTRRRGAGDRLRGQRGARSRGPPGTRTRAATDFDDNNIFASRFDNTGDANQGKWIFGGQGRGTGGGSVQVPSLNIHTDQSAENPSVAGGSAVDPTKPGPWVTWQETTERPVAGEDQIFVERPIGPGAANCDGVKPAGVVVDGHVPAIGGFCFQQTGVPRVGPAARPEPERGPHARRDRAGHRVRGRRRTAFRGSSGTRKARGGIGLHENEMVFAAKGVSDGDGANGGFHWVVVGSGLSGTLDTQRDQRVRRVRRIGSETRRCAR